MPSVNSSAIAPPAVVNNCRLPQSVESFFTFHIEHIVPRQHAGATDERNLALSCHHRNLHKGPTPTAIDPDTGSTVLLFNPRTQAWDEHFTMQGAAVTGLTPIGRATVRLLKM